MRNIIFPLITLCIFSGCKAMDAVDATLSMSKTTSNMANTTRDMKATTEKMSNTTGWGIHQQTLKLASDAMSNVKDTESLVPPSVNLMAGALSFAREARTDESHIWVNGADEIMDYVYTTLAYINQRPAPNASTKACPGFSEPQSCNDADRTVANNIARFNHDSLVKIMQLEAVAGQIAQSVPEKQEEAATVEKIIAAQANGGFREQTLYQFLMLRAMFIHDIFLGKELFHDGIKNMAQLRSAYTYVQNLQFIANQAFVGQIGIQTTAIYSAIEDGKGGWNIALAAANKQGSSADADLKVLFNPQMVQDSWSDLYDQISNLPENLTENSSAKNEIDAITADALKHISN